MSEVFDPRNSYNKTADTDVTYTGASYPSLGITKGDKLTSVIKKVADSLSKLADIESRLTSLEKGTGTDSSAIQANSLLFDLVDHSEVISHSLESKKVDVEIKNSSVAGRVDINFDFADSLAGLDPKYVPVGIETSIRTYDAANKLLGSSSSRTGILTIDNQTGPVIVNSRVNLKTADGDLVLTKAFHIPTLTAQSLSGTFKVTGISPKEAGSITQKQYNEVLASTVSKLQKDIAALEKGVSAIQ